MQEQVNPVNLHTGSSLTMFERLLGPAVVASETFQDRATASTGRGKCGFRFAPSNPKVLLRALKPTREGHIALQFSGI